MLGEFFSYNFLSNFFYFGNDLNIISFHSIDYFYINCCLILKNCMNSLFEVFFLNVFGNPCINLLLWFLFLNGWLLFVLAEERFNFFFNWISMGSSEFRKFQFFYVRKMLRSVIFVGLMFVWPDVHSDLICWSQTLLWARFVIILLIAVADGFVFY